MNTDELKKLVFEGFQSGKSKNELAGILITNGIEFSKVEKFLKDAGCSFKRVASKWDQFTDFWVENGGGSKEELVKYLQVEHDWDEKDAKKYSASYYYPINRVFESQIESDEVETDEPAE